MRELWHGLIEGLSSFLRLLHDGTVPVFDVYAWGWAIILLTFAVRLVLLPLAVKQTNSMRAIQKLKPEIDKIQKRYRADRSMMRTNPEKYRERKQRQQQAIMQLYREHNVNPAASCLPLVLQFPIFIALYRVLYDGVPELETAPFYLINSLASRPSQGLAAAGIGSFVLLVLTAVTMFVQQRQMQARTPMTPEQQAQQRLLLYVMPVVLTVLAFNLPAGVLLYWVATNVWQVAQQYVMFRNVEPVGALAAQRPAKGQ